MFVVPSETGVINIKNYTGLEGTIHVRMNNYSIFFITLLATYRNDDYLYNKNKGKTKREKKNTNRKYPQKTVVIQPVRMFHFSFCMTSFSKVGTTWPLFLRLNPPQYQEPILSTNRRNLRHLILSFSIFSDVVGLIQTMSHRPNN